MMQRPDKLGASIIHELSGFIGYLCDSDNDTVLFTLKALACFRHPERLKGAWDILSRAH